MGDGPNYILYRPYHLCSLETPLSAAMAVLDHKATIVPKAGLVAEVMTIAKKDLKKVSLWMAMEHIHAMVL